MLAGQQWNQACFAIADEAVAVHGCWIGRGPPECDHAVIHSETALRAARREIAHGAKGY
ncbi:MAG: hypothetical protein L0Y50_13380 [Beijerinckiaceae bacterium]|nr:hypothetical protein [Beijerinckiaceae bacterium]